jgi:zinc protease
MNLRVFAASLLLAFASAHAALPPGVKEVAAVEGITEYRLDNGLRVVLFPDAGSASTSVNVTYLVGSRHEKYGETGMAHLLEHLLFKGTEKGGNIWAEMTKRGMRNNGSTWYDRTNYFETFNASPADLEWAISMEADRMVNSRVDRKDLDTEMTVVRNEMERGENSPGRVLWQRAIGAAYRWHNYGKETIGARSDVEGVDIESLRAFYRTYYQPDNAVLVIAGSFDRDQTLGWIAKYFGAIPKPTRTLPRLYTVEPVQDGERLVTIRRVGDQQLLGIAYHAVPGAHPDYVATEALGEIMSIEPAGRLYKALVETKKASGVGQTFSPSLFDPGFLFFSAQVPLSDSIEPAREAAIATLEGVAKAPITQAELDRVRARALKEVDEALADPTRFGIRLSESIAAGDWRLFFLTRDRWRTVTREDVQRVALQYLKPANRTVAMFIPDAKPDRAPPSAPVDVVAMLKDYKGDPAAGAGELFVATPANLEARTQRFTLPNGMKVALMPKKTRGETVKVALQVDQGDEKSLFGKSPQGGLMAAMLARGTQKRSRQDIEDTLDKLRSKVSFAGNEARTAAAVETYRKELPDTLRLVAEMLREPAFPEAEYAKLQREEITDLEGSRTDPEKVTRRAVRRYGNPYPVGDPRYVPTIEEAIALVRKTSVEDIRRFHKTFVGGIGEIAIVGDFDPAAARKVLEESFGTWSKAAPHARIPDPFVKKAPTVATIETPDKANAALVGDLALSISDESPEFGATTVASYLLGEGATSRLWRRIRERDGLSYSVYAYVGWNSFEPNSTLNVMAIFAPQNRARLATALNEEFARVASEGFTDAEVEEGKAIVLKRRLLSRSQDANVAAALVQQLYIGRTWTFSEKADAAVAAATPASVNAAFRKYMRPDGLALVYAGDFAKHVASKAN